jgi:hypothetical protein
MKKSRVLLICGGAALSLLPGGCATYYEDLMTNQQIIAADCTQLAEEEQKLDSNIQASQEGQGIGIRAFWGWRTWRRKPARTARQLRRSGKRPATAGNSPTTGPTARIW